MTRTDTAELGRALQALGGRVRAMGERLEAFAASPEELTEIVAALDTTRRELLAVRAALGPSGCPLHPQVPVDPTAGGRCLICAQNQRVGQPPADPIAVARTFAEICQYIAEHGQDAAERRYGARAVTRAVLHCRRDQPLQEPV